MTFHSLTLLFSAELGVTDFEQTAIYKNRCFQFQFQLQNLSILLSSSYQVLNEMYLTLRLRGKLNYILMDTYYGGFGAKAISLNHFSFVKSEREGWHLNCCCFHHVPHPQNRAQLLSIYNDATY